MEETRVEGTTPKSDTACVSKNSLKRKRRAELLKAVWEKKKLLRKAQRKAQSAGREEVSRPPSVKAARKEKIAEERAAFRRLVESSQRVVIDLEFNDLMTVSEQKSLSQQIMYSYGENKNIHLTGLSGMVQSQLEKVNGFPSWAVSPSHDSYLSLFPKEELVYLTADSENTIEDLSRDKVYIIGGIVDRNRYKQLTLLKAQGQGLQTAKLPIDIHLLSSHVLTVNHVVSILLHFQESHSWRDAVASVLPQRKVAGESNMGKRQRRRMKHAEAEDGKEGKEEREREKDEEKDAKGDKEPEEKEKEKE